MRKISQQINALKNVFILKFSSSCHKWMFWKKVLSKIWRKSKMIINDISVIFCLPDVMKSKVQAKNFFPTWRYLKKIFFWCDLPLLAVFIIIVLFCHQVVRFIHLVFRRTQELNSRPRTLAQTVSLWHSPLDQGASPTWMYFTNAKKAKK